jgi:hypothetical protein
MRRILFIGLALMAVFSCREKKSGIDPYAAPWNTKFIKHKNIQCDTHNEGYQLYYKEMLLESGCGYFGFCHLESPFIVNDSIMLFFKAIDQHGEVLYTGTGGVSWLETYVGSASFIQFHLVNTKLTYCVTGSAGDRYFTGIGKSTLSAYKTTATKGRHYISDLGTSVTEQDSTVITMNDSLSFVVVFK